MAIGHIVDTKHSEIQIYWVKLDERINSTTIYEFSLFVENEASDAKRNKSSAVAQSMTLLRTSLRSISSFLLVVCVKNDLATCKQTQFFSLQVKNIMCSMVAE